MLSKKRLITAYILAPLMPAICYYIWIDIINIPNKDSGSQLTFIIILLTLPLSYLSCFIGGYYYINYYNIKNIMPLIVLTLIGFIMGAILLYLYLHFVSYMFGTQGNIIPTAYELLFGGLFGVSVALPFGLIAGIPLLGRHSDTN